MPSADSSLKPTPHKNAELTAYREVHEHINAALVGRLEGENRQLEQQLIKLTQHAEALEREKLGLRAQLDRYCELNVLLKEELAWWKAHVFGRSSEKDASEVSHQGVKIAPLPPQLLPKSMASPSRLTHITTTKFVDGVPLTRQCKQFDRLGLALTAATMGVWMNTIGAHKLSDQPDARGGPRRTGPALR